MIKAIDINEELSKTEYLEGRSPETPDDLVNKAFTTLSDYDNGGVFTGSYSGDSPWERHTKGDELVHILAGETKLTVLTETGTKMLDLKAGMLCVVPKGLWHRFNAPHGVTVLSVTPQPTEHSIEEDPRV